MMQALLLRRSLLVSSANLTGSLRPSRWLSSKSYSKTHEWIDSDGRVGISEFAQSELGDVVYVELPEVGANFKAGDSFGSIESVKAASDIYAPVSGEVIEVNKDLKDNPGMVNEDAEGKGWMLKLKLGATADVETKSLLDKKSYVDLTKK